MSRKYRQARTEAQRVLQTAPKSVGALRTLEYAEVLERDCPSARSSYADELRLLPNSPTAGAGQVFIDAWCGRPDQARQRLSALIAGNPSTSPYILAGLFARLNQTDQAIHYLQASAQRREQTILYLKIDPQFDKIRNDPRYLALENQIGLRNSN
jgi:predicted Zn-dependent protease